jgi:hypothetical protein
LTARAFSSEACPGLSRDWRKNFLVGDLFLADGLRGRTELHRGGIPGLSKHAQAGLTTIGTFNDFAGDDPTSPVFLASGWKE